MNATGKWLGSALGSAAALGLIWCGAILAQDEGAMPFDRASAVGDWIHEDIEAGYAAALESGKPLLVAFR